jgi:hypothetical protein
MLNESFFTEFYIVCRSSTNMDGELKNGLIASIIIIISIVVLLNIMKSNNLHLSKYLTPDEKIKLKSDSFPPTPLAEIYEVRIYDNGLARLSIDLREGLN